MMKTQNQQRAVLYANGSFVNRGCEAIARGCHKVLREANIEMSMGSTAMTVDQAMADELNIQLIRVPRSRESFLEIVSEVFRRLKLRKLSAAVPFVAMRQMGKQFDYSFSTGGDNYCYDGRERYYRMNRNIRSKNCKNYFWGCSLEESAFDEVMRKDLEGFDAIFARETRTYNMLIQKGLTNVVKCTDPAFLMEKKECDFPGKDSGKKFIGFNISPLTTNCSPDPEKTFEIVTQVIQAVLDQTDYDVLLIPHVYGPESDHAIHCKIAEKLANDRITVIPEKYNAPELKYIISRCDAFIGSRTHSTIAAYSTCVPTLVLGYSIKSVGIAEDLFGTSEGYVLKAQDGFTYEGFLENVMGLIAEKDNQKAHLQKIMDAYAKDAYVIAEVIKNGEIIGS